MEDMTGLGHIYGPDSNSVSLRTRGSVCCPDAGEYDCGAW
jgi:hypothetical protein